MIDLSHIHKNYHAREGDVTALRDVSLHVEKSDIFGIIGYSGAGKSTLVRCINLLERPDAGTVTVAGRELTALKERELCAARRKIGMIFQHFNLLRSATVFQNVAFPISHIGLKKPAVRERVESLLDLVGLTDKAGAYPAQLSGGQKQRVAIARALANEPDVLLSDEATSALDPQTTASILELLRDLNRKLGLTIVMITHQMPVVKEICNRVAVLDQGMIVEQGPAIELFSRPKHPATREFVSSLFQTEKLEKMLRSGYLAERLAGGEILVHLIFTGGSANEAYISQVSRRFDMDLSVIYGAIETIQEQPVGSLFVLMRGDSEQAGRALAYLRRSGVNAEVLSGFSGFAAGEKGGGRKCMNGSSV